MIVWSAGIEVSQDGFFYMNLITSNRFRHDYRITRDTIFYSYLKLYLFP